MAIILSHNTALWAIRMLRSEGADLRLWADYTVVANPTPWVGKRWSMREFASAEWHWPKPSKECELHVLVPSRQRVRMRYVRAHQCGCGLPPQSILWVDEHAGVVCPELLFVQMAETLELGQLVMLGNELCGTFTRSAHNPVGGPVVDHVAPAATVDGIQWYLEQVVGVRGAQRARLALAHVRDGAASVPEAKLATMYDLPRAECGYGMGPIVLNEYVQVNKTQKPQEQRGRYPDILFSFAPIGINYDGEKDHLDLGGLVRLARTSALVDNKDRVKANRALAKKLGATRDKAVDDMRRNREFLAKGLVILPATKEDVNGIDNLDNFTRQLRGCAQAFFGVDVSEYEKALDDTGSRRDRSDLWKSL